MMYLHEDAGLFRAISEKTSSETGIPRGMVEKDYYVTMILKLLARRCPNIVFKGGTSLSKCFHVIDRFSEDIDITFTEHIGEARRKKLKYDTIIPVSSALGLPIVNLADVQSDRDYNCYLFQYHSVFDQPDPEIHSYVKLETALVTYAFPVEQMSVTSYIGNESGSIDNVILEKYELNSFSMNVQSLERTFIDKIFAVCDYYMENRPTAHSRHLYDLYKLSPNIVIDESFMELLHQVRMQRAKLSICPSAKPDADIIRCLHEISDSDFYKADYNNVTKNLIMDDVSYPQTIRTLKTICRQLSITP